MSSLIGQRLGQYEIVSLLGAGGMAYVYRARQTSIKRDVAVKVIKADLTDTPESAMFLTRFEREAQAVASLSHPHILKIFDYGQESGRVYLVMELLTGGSLANLIRQRPLTVLEVLRVLQQIGSALDYAHSRTIIHRDMKPQNVLLDEQGNAFLTDFGIAKLLSEANLTQSGIAMGTPAYMAPEQWQGQTIDGRADIYALGIMCYEMLTGTPPYVADTPFALMHKHFYESPPTLNLSRPDLPTAFSDVIAKAVAKSPDDRFTTAAQMTAAFESAMSGRSPERPIAAPSLSDQTEPLIIKSSPGAAPKGTPLVTQPPPADTRRTPWLPIGIAAVVLFVLVAAGAFLLSNRSSNASNVTPTVAVIVPSSTAQGVVIQPTQATPTSTQTTVATLTSTQTTAATLSATPVVPSNTAATVISTTVAATLAPLAIATTAQPPTLTSTLPNTATQTLLPTETSTSIFTATPVPSATTAPSATLTQSPRPSATYTPTKLPTATLDVERTLQALAATQTALIIAAYTKTPTDSPTATASATLTPTTAVTNTPTQTPLPSLTPTIQPTGLGRIVYQNNRDGNVNIYTMKVDGTDIRQVTKGKGGNAEPAWSPDGKWIAYMSAQSGTMNQIYVISPDGTNQRRVTKAGVDGSHPQWSPDGKQIVFWAKRNNPKAGIYVINLDGSNERRLSANDVEDATPAWSPDGKTIIFASARTGHNQIYAMDVDGKNVRPLTSDTAYNGLPKYSPDGKFITFSSDRTGNFQIFVMNADGNDPRQLTFSKAFEAASNYSPDGKYMVFTSTRDSSTAVNLTKDYQIYVMDADGQNVRRVTGDYYNSSASFSP